MNEYKAVGIIAEYNPFHNGHKYHLDKAKELSGADYAVAVMSGNFVQRGEAAFFNKWERARIAIECGIDLVLELPFAFACNDAGAFARGGIGILDGLGFISHLAFGSETGNIDMIRETSNLLVTEDDGLSLKIKEELKKGSSYPKARYEAFRSIRPDLKEALRQPNDILAVEYLSEIKRLGSDIRPLPIKRIGAGYSDEDLHKEISGASAIRKAILIGNIEGIKDCVPDTTWDLIRTNVFPDPNEKMLFDFIRFKILSETADSLENIYSITEGLNNKLVKEIIKSKDLNDFIDRVKSKRYTRTRIRRVLVHTLMNLSTTDYKIFDNGSCLYARILGFSKKGSELIRKSKKDNKSNIPFLTNINKSILDKEREKLLMYDIRSSDLYNLISGNEIYAYSDRVKKPFVTD